MNIYNCLEKKLSKDQLFKSLQSLQSPYSLPTVPPASSCFIMEKFAKNNTGIETENFLDGKEARQTPLLKSSCFFKQ